MIYIYMIYIYSICITYIDRIVEYFLVGKKVLRCYLFLGAAWATWKYSFNTSYFFNYISFANLFVEYFSKIGFLYINKNLGLFYITYFNKMG